MDDPDNPIDPASQEFVYPDIDENVQYPWQSAQQSTQESFPSDDFAAVIDPQLYRNLFAQNITENPEQVQDQHLERSYSVDGTSELPDEAVEVYQQNFNGVDEGEYDSDFLYSEENGERYDFLVTITTFLY